MLLKLIAQGWVKVHFQLNKKVIIKIINFLFSKIIFFLDKVGESIQKIGHEFGATTGRPIRCGWLDLPFLKI